MPRKIDLLSTESLALIAVTVNAAYTQLLLGRIPTRTSLSGVTYLLEALLSENPPFWSLRIDVSLCLKTTRRSLISTD